MTIDTIDDFAVFAAGDRVEDDDQTTRFLGEMTTLYAVSVLRAIPRRPDLVDQLIAALESAPPRPLWDLSLGQLRRAMRSTALGADPGLAQFAIYAGAVADGIGPWELAFTKPQTVRIGEAVIGGIRAIACDGRGGYAYDPAADRRELRSVANPFGTSVVLDRDALPEWLRDEASGVPEHMTGTCAALWRDALELLQDHAPAYAQWVRRAVRAVIPVDNPPEVLISGSDDRRPSVITASANTTVDGMVEILVHEAAHQYMYAATKAAPLDDGTDTKLYYSPVKGADRPIGKLLVAFHAVGNVLLLARILIGHGQDRHGYWAKNIERLGPQLAALDQALNANSSLTHVGTCLYRPLRARLTGRGLLP